MAVRLVHVHVKPEHVEGFIELIRSNHLGSVAEPGNVGSTYSVRPTTPRGSCCTSGTPRTKPQPRIGRHPITRRSPRRSPTGWWSHATPMPTRRSSRSSRVASRFALSRLPRITFGPGTIPELSAAVARYGRRCLLVTGGRSFDELGLSDLGERLLVAGVELVGHVRASAEPGPEVIDAFAATARDLEADVVVGLGGGSVLDTAKAVAGLARSGSSVMDHLEGVGRGPTWPGRADPFLGGPHDRRNRSEASRNGARHTVHGTDGLQGARSGRAARGAGGAH